MSYQPVPNNSNADGTKIIELGEDSETDVEGRSRNSEDWKPRGIGRINIQDFYKKACEANIPLVVSLHLLLFNVILSIFMILQLWRGLQCSSEAKPNSQFAPGELLWSQYITCHSRPLYVYRLNMGLHIKLSDRILLRIEWREPTLGQASRRIGYPAHTKAGQMTKTMPFGRNMKVNSSNRGRRLSLELTCCGVYVAGSHIRITKEEAAHLDHPTAHFPTEKYKDHYLVGLVVFHQLHCVSNLRRALYPKRYNSSLIDEDGNVDYAKWHHLDHCLDQLRTYLECHPEMTAMPFFVADESINLVYPLTTRK